MIYALLASQIAWVVVCLALLRAWRQEAAQGLSERRELITRITHPEILPTPEPGPQEVLEEDDEFALVGSIQLGEPQT